jgi:hypothetical protein
MHEKVCMPTEALGKMYHKSCFCHLQNNENSNFSAVNPEIKCKENNPLRVFSKLPEKVFNGRLKSRVFGIPSNLS